MEAARPLSQSPIGAIGDWVMKRGILYALTQTPIVALYVGYFFRLTNYPMATVFSVLVAFLALPFWVLYRKSISKDPDEPVQDFMSYALWAIIPYVFYNIARIPMHYLLQIVFWDHWYDFGSEFTGIPVDQYGSLIPGTVLHSIQGYVLALGFYILFKRHSLLNALLYIFAYLSSLYSFTFPVFVLVDWTPPPKWYFVVWWAHFWMAIAAWYVPKFFTQRFNQMLRRGRAATLLGLAIPWLIPFAFVFWRAGTWQYPYQHQIDQATFSRQNLITLNGAPTLVANGQEAHYQFNLRIGPRPYKDYIRATKALDAGPVKVTGHLLSQGEIVAWCTTYIPEIETPNNIKDPLIYFPTLQKMEYTDIQVECVGPASVASKLSSGSQVEVKWNAKVNLVGDREEEERDFDGDEQTQLSIAPNVAQK